MIAMRLNRLRKLGSRLRVAFLGPQLDDRRKLPPVFSLFGKLMRSPNPEKVF